MFNFAQRRYLFFTISAFIIIPGVIAMIISTASFGSPVKLSIDFTGGTLLDVSFVEDYGEQEIRDGLGEYGLDDYVVQRLDPISDEAIEGNQNEANSRFLITLPDNTDVVGLQNALSGEEGVSEFWSSLSTDDDPEREDAINVTSLPDEGQATMDVSFVDVVSAEDLTAAIEAFGVEGDFEVTPTEVLKAQAGSRWQIRTEELETDKIDSLKVFLAEEIGDFWTLTPRNPEAEISSSSVSATVGEEVTQAAFVATMAVAVIVLGFIVFAFRKVPQSFRYGACAIIAMFHDILVTMGIMSILGLLFDWEVDALFLTAILTVVGFSVQDSIVVFDRIRENIPRHRDEPYEQIVNRSVLETVHRSLATQLNAIFVMIAILLFGGETIRQFIGILLIGLMSGTYSSIFNAVPLLVAWEKGEIPFVNREAKRRRKQAEAAM